MAFAMHSPLASSELIRERAGRVVQAHGAASVACCVPVHRETDRTRSVTIGKAPRRVNSANARRKQSRGAVRVSAHAANWVAGAASSPAPASGLAAIRAKIAEKVQADPNFLFKLCIEILIDEVITVVVNVLTRGSPMSWSAATWAQVICQCFVAMFNDIALVWALAPEGDGKIAHCFQEGKFTVKDRIFCWFDKWKLYSVIGTLTGLLSMVATGVISADAQLLGRVVLIKAAITGGLHLGISANSRYQIVNGIEVLLYKNFPMEAARAGSTLVRMANNFAGARLWMVAAALVNGFF